MSKNPKAQGEPNDKLNGLDLSALKELATFLSIDAQRDWSEADYIEAIKGAKAQLDKEGFGGVSLPHLEDKNQGTAGTPPPGHAKIIIHRDPTPGHANSAVMLGVNGRILNVPRGVECIVPTPYVGMLQNAVQTVMRQKKEPSSSNPAGEIVYEDMLSYPFQVLSITPGGEGFRNGFDQRGAVALRKEAFVKKHKRWPTQGELHKFEELQMMAEQRVLDEEARQRSSK